MSVVVHRLSSRGACEATRSATRPSASSHVYLPPGLDPARPLSRAARGRRLHGHGGDAVQHRSARRGPDARASIGSSFRRCPSAWSSRPTASTASAATSTSTRRRSAATRIILLDEIMPFVEKQVPSAWAVFGKSSGRLRLDRPRDAAPGGVPGPRGHSGDSNFELCYIADFPSALDAFRDAGGPTAWLDSYWADVNRHRKKYHGARLPRHGGALLAEPGAPAPRHRFPVRPRDGRFHSRGVEAMARVGSGQMVDRTRTRSRSCKLVYVDCGTRDEFTLVWGARALEPTPRGGREDALRGVRRRSHGDSLPLRRELADAREGART